MIALLAINVALAIVFDAALKTSDLNIGLQVRTFSPERGLETKAVDPEAEVILHRGDTGNLLRLSWGAQQLVGKAFLEFGLVGEVSITQGQSRVSAANLSYCRSVRMQLTCRVPIQLSADPDPVIFTALTPAASVTGIKVRGFSLHQETWDTELPIFLLLILFAPIAAAVGFIRQPRTRRNGVIGASAAFLLLLSPYLMLFVALLMSFSFYAARAVSLKRARLRDFIFLMLGIIVLAKLIWPISGSVLTLGAEWIVVPIGLSYLVARYIDLVVKLSSGQAPMPPWGDFLAYSIFWPSFSAGPITEINAFRTDGRDYPAWPDRAQGMVRIARGFAKKAAADMIALGLVSPRFEMMLWPDHTPTDTALLFLGNLLFVYLDFSGYSDIAVGSARLAGIHIPENFDNPLLKSNLRQFWRSWHMSLTRWVNRNVFMPISMSTRREHELIAYAVPVMATTMTIGLWHGFQIIWLLWGLHHAVGIFITDRCINYWERSKKHLPVLRSRWASGTVYVFGVAFVWYWLMLSYSFTLSSNLAVSLQNYWNALLLPISLPVDLFVRLLT